jgi:hypothetical protein
MCLDTCRSRQIRPPATISNPSSGLHDGRRSLRRPHWCFMAVVTTRVDRRSWSRLGTGPALSCLCLNGNLSRLLCCLVVSVIWIKTCHLYYVIVLLLLGHACKLFDLVVGLLAYLCIRIPQTGLFVFIHFLLR